jgi:hypothetical protein
MVGVSSSRSLRNAQQTAAKHQLNWRSFQDTEQGEIGKAFGVTDLPCAVVIDRNGIVRSNTSDAEETERIVRDLLSQPSEVKK